MSSSDLPVSSRIALTTDSLLADSNNRNSFIVRNAEKAAARTVAAALPFGAVVDGIGSAVNMTREGVLGIVTSDPEQRRAAFQRASSSSANVLKATRGVLFSPLAAACSAPDMLTHHFLPHAHPSNKLESLGKLYAVEGQEFFPGTEEELRSIVLEGKQQGKKISVRGAGMCQGMQALPHEDGHILINMKRFNQVYLNTEPKTALVGAGATWQEVQNTAHPYNLAVQVMQASNVFSVGGSLSANCHGWDYHAGVLGNTILSMRVMNANGEVMELTPGDELFHCVIGGYGLFGIVMDITLQLTNNQLLEQQGWMIPPDVYYSYFCQNVKNNPDIAMALYRLSLKPGEIFKEGISVEYRKMEEIAPQKPLVDEGEIGSTLHRVELQCARRSSKARGIAWELVKKTTVGKQEPQSRNSIMRPPINAIKNESMIDAEWLQEYLVEGEKLGDFLQFLGARLESNDVILLNATVRFVAKDQVSKMGYAAGGDRIAIVLFFTQPLDRKSIQKTRRWVKEVVEHLAQIGGCSYPPYQQFPTKTQFWKIFKQAKEIQELKLKYDPEELFTSGWYNKYLKGKAIMQIDTSAMVPGNHYRELLSTERGRGKVRDFIDNVFMQISANNFFTVMDDILSNPDANDTTIYTELKARISETRNGLTSLPIRPGYDAIRSLRLLKNELAELISQLFDEKRCTFQGSVEIGYPGRMIRPLHKKFDVQGPIIVINDLPESGGDRIQWGIPRLIRPYHQRFMLNEYAPISEADIPSNSVDFVQVWIGLHHIPEEMIDSFIKSIQRILRVDGSFVLMDHDAHNAHLRDLDWVIHSIFNAATGVSDEEEEKEVRNFQSLQYWIDRVESAGFHKSEHEPRIRAGDPTLNALVRFVKIGNSLEVIESNLMKEEGYVRHQSQTFGTAAEWHSVEMSRMLAVTANGDRSHSYNYPHFKEVKDIWSVYVKSLMKAKEHSSFKDLLFSDKTLMSGFVTFFTTMEQIYNGITSAPLRWMRGSDAPQTAVEKEVADYLEKYSKAIEHTPFYEFPFKEAADSIWKSLWNSDNKIADFYLVMSKSFKLLCDRGVSFVPRMMYGSGENKEAGTIHLLVKGLHNGKTYEGIEEREDFPADGITHIEAPRYLPFTELLKQFSEDGVQCVNIAGQKKIMVRVNVDAGRELEPGDGYSACFSVDMPADDKHKIVFLEADIEKLHLVLADLKEKGIEVAYIHDF